VTDGKFFNAQIMLFIHKKSKKVKISEKFFSFFSTLNQYLPHIPYVASKNELSAADEFQKRFGCGQANQ
jgi:hypothetical protein